MNDWKRGCVVLPKNNSVLFNNVNLDYYVYYKILQKLEGSFGVLCLGTGVI